MTDGKNHSQDARIAQLEAELASTREELAVVKSQSDLYSMLSSIFDVSSEAIFVCNLDYTVSATNKAFQNVTGYSQNDEELLNLNDLFTHNKADELMASIRKKMDSGGFWQGETFNIMKDDRAYRAWMTFSPYISADGEVTGYVGILRDITDEKETEARLWHQSHFDLVTDLPNWSLFLNRFLQALYEAGHSDSRAALLYIGLDGFKVINDTLGHTIGDKILQESARRFADILPPNATVARYSGDQFTAVIPEVADDEAVKQWAIQVLECMQNPFEIEEEEIFVSCSIGICTWPGDGDDVETLLRNADAAMHKAKDAGRNTYRFFRPEMDARAQARRSLERDLRNAVKNFDEFFLVYQPVMNLRTGMVSNAEALIRWHNAERGMVSPDQFISLSEESSLILDIGEWVIHKACEETATWIETTEFPLSVAINISGRQFRDHALPRIVDDALRSSGLKPEHLILEITETLMMEDTEAVIEKLNAMKEMGIRLSIDDFGTGYSSLSYLKNFPLDTLKIDRAFIRDVTNNPDDAALVSAIISMGKSLDLKVVAEGIEVEEQEAFLRQKGCDYGQGYRYSRPLRLMDFKQFLTDAPFANSA